MKPDLLKGLTKEQTKKFRACKTHEEMLKAAKEEGIELTQEQLEAISGGGLCSDGGFDNGGCPKCFYDTTYYYYNEQGQKVNYCDYCDYEWISK